MKVVELDEVDCDVTVDREPRRAVSSGLDGRGKTVFRAEFESPTGLIR